MKPLRKIYLTLGIFGILIILLIVFLVLPFFRNIKNNFNDLISKKKELVTLNFEIENLGAIRQKYEGYKPDLEKIDTLFINSEVPVDFIKFLEKLASNSKISVKISSYAAQKSQNQPWPSIQFQLIAAGSFENVSRFLEKLENSPYLIKIQNLIIRKISQDELSQPEWKNLSPGDVSSSLLIEVFTK